MTLLTNASIRAPLPDDFDVDSWMAVDVICSPPNLSLKNKLNCEAEEFNNASIKATERCCIDRESFPDVGPKP